MSKFRAESIGWSTSVPLMNLANDAGLFNISRTLADWDGQLMEIGIAGLGLCWVG